MPRLKISKKQKNERLEEIYKDISRKTGVDVLKVFAICAEMYVELNKIILEDIKVKIHGFMELTKKVSLPRYAIDKRCNAVYLTKGKTSLSVKIDRDLLAKLKELAGHNGKNQN